MAGEGDRGASGGANHYRGGNRVAGRDFPRTGVRIIDANVRERPASLADAGAHWRGDSSSETAKRRAIDEGRRGGSRTPGAAAADRATAAETIELEEVSAADGVADAREGQSRRGARAQLVLGHVLEASAGHEKSTRGQNARYHQSHHCQSPWCCLSAEREENPRVSSGQVGGVDRGPALAACPEITVHEGLVGGRAGRSFGPAGHGIHLAQAAGVSTPGLMPGVARDFAGE